MEEYTARKLLTIVSEAALESRLVAAIEQLGAHGYTVTDARGKGHRGVRSSAWEVNSNIRIEVVCDASTADAIADHLQAHYYANFAMILFISEVAVLRSEKF